MNKSKKKIIPGTRKTYLQRKKEALLGRVNISLKSWKSGSTMKMPVDQKQTTQEFLPQQSDHNTDTETGESDADEKKLNQNHKVHPNPMMICHYLMSDISMEKISINGLKELQSEQSGVQHII